MESHYPTQAKIRLEWGTQHLSRWQLTNLGHPSRERGFLALSTLQVVLGTRLDQGEKLGAGVLLVEDSHHGRGHG
jgi:hypothetical protein